MNVQKSENSESDSPLKDNRERKRERKTLRRRGKRLRKREKSQRQVRSADETENTVFVQLRLIQFPSQYLKVIYNNRLFYHNFLDNTIKNLYKTR